MGGMPALVWGIVAVSAIICVAILKWAPRMQICSFCGRRNPPKATRCECGLDLTRTRLRAHEREKLATVVGEAGLAETEKWLDAAGVREPLSWPSWFALETACKAVSVRRMDVVRDLLGKIDELSDDSRARLLQSAEGSIVIRNALEGRLELLEVGYEAASRTYEFTAYVGDDLFGERRPPRLLPTLRTMVAERRDGDGNPVDTVRVVFHDEQHARRHAAELRAAGARVYYMDRTTGDLAEP